jgi:hypothetical protein
MIDAHIAPRRTLSHLNTPAIAARRSFHRVVGNLADQAPSSWAQPRATGAAEPDVLYGVSGGVHDDGYADQADEGPTYRSGQNAPARASDTPQPTRPDLSGELGDTAPSSRSAKERALNWSGYCRGMSWSSSLASAVRIP